MLEVDVTTLECDGPHRIFYFYKKKAELRCWFHEVKHNERLMYQIEYNNLAFEHI